MKDQNYNSLSGDVYRVDKMKSDDPINLGELVDDKQFKVIKVEDNQENGMQAMEVVPIKEGKVDDTQIIIAYAGTNFSDSRDRETDLYNIGIGD